MTNSRMNWLVFVLSVGILVSRPMVVSAQTTFGVAGGPSFPTGSLGDAVGTGFHAGIVIDVGLAFLPLSLRGDAMFQQLPGIESGEDFHQISGVMNARLSLLPAPLISFYLTTGLGLYGSSYDPVAGADGSTVDVGFNGGAGARVNLLVIRPFVEARYHRVLSDPTRGFVPLTIGVYF